MPNPRSSRPRSSMSPSPGPNGSAAPSRQPEGQIEVLYNQAVQSFVRKDHVKTQAILGRLLKLLEGEALPKTPWNALGVASNPTTEEKEAEEWTIKTLKLLISSHASLYADQASSKVVNPDISALISGPPSALLQYLQDACDTALHTTTTPLPPALLLTLLLASLKLKPSRDALGWAHTLAENWIVALDGAFIDAISRPSKADPEQSRRTESAREGYIKVVELFVGEVLAREGEWEMARALLEGEVVMGSRRRENLYRHLRGMETKARSSASPASSSILPSPSSSGILPPQSPTPGRSRSASGSSSSSEATARPATDKRTSTGTNGTPVPARLVNGVDRKGKAEAPVDVVSESSASTMPRPLPNKFIINHGGSSRETEGANGPTTKRGGSIYDQVTALLPAPIQAVLRRLPLRWLSLALPLPLLLVALILTLRRRRQRTAVAGAAGGAVAASSTDALEVVRERLRQARERGMWKWVVWWFKWWISKFVGVWKLGTTITYV